MSRKKTRTKQERERTPVQKALIELRARLRLTQAKLATLMNVQLPSVGRWETSEPPTNLALAVLHGIATKNEFHDLAATFRDELEALKAAQSDKANEALDEIERWKKIREHIETLAKDAGKIEDARLGDRMIKRLRDLNELLAAAQQRSWRNR